MLLSSPSDRPFEVLRAIADCLQSMGGQSIEQYLTATEILPSPLGEPYRVWRWWLDRARVLDTSVTCFEVVIVLGRRLVFASGHNSMLWRGIVLLDQSEEWWLLAAADHDHESDAELAEHARVLLDEVLAGGN